MIKKIFINIYRETKGGKKRKKYRERVRKRDNINKKYVNIHIYHIQREKRERHRKKYRERVRKRDNINKKYVNLHMTHCIQEGHKIDI